MGGGEKEKRRKGEKKLVFDGLPWPCGWVPIAGPILLNSNSSLRVSAPPRFKKNTRRIPEN